MKIGFTGTRAGMTQAQQIVLGNLLEAFLPELAAFHHGDCQGSDAEAHGIAVYLGLNVFIHPPEDNRLRAYCAGAVKVYGPQSYHTRNRAIVEGTDFLIATPFEQEEMPTGGTWYTIRYARRQGKRVLIIYPDGIVVEKGEPKDSPDLS